MKSIMNILAVILLASALAACKDKPEVKKAEPVRKPSVQANTLKGAVKAVTAEAKKAKKTIEAITYDPEGRRDPFLSIIVLTKQKVEKKKKTVNPLENYDVTDFRLLGVVYADNDYYASVVLPDGKAYTIKKGTTLGLYGGKVIDIKSDTVVIREYIVDYRGQLRPKDTVLKLRKEEE
ncbi:MAG: pilus assembly protein PilP [Nitrospirae bacterium]|nr:pilus assembly protein PilP [Nitrospirota bacterium]